MQAPDGAVYYGLGWGAFSKPALGLILVPENLDISDVSIMKIVIPYNKPPISMPGEYTFSIYATKPGTGKLISNMATVNFVVK